MTSHPSFPFEDQLPEPVSRPGAAGPWFVLRVAREQDFPRIVSLAESIWWHCYPPIIGAAQVHHMLSRGYSVGELRRQARAGSRFRLLWAGSRAIGFLAWQPQAAEAFLDKIYLQPAFHGLGLGRRMLAAVAAEALMEGHAALTLRVNRHNHPAIRAYRRAGFQWAGEHRKPIGAGFVMDDYVMRLTLPDRHLLD